MTLDEFMAQHADYYIGAISLLPDDLPDGAWMQIRIETIEFLSQPENLRHLATGSREGFQFDSYDIFHWLGVRGLV